MSSWWLASKAGAGAGAGEAAVEDVVPTGYRMGSTRISLWSQGWLARTQFALGAWPDALETVQRAAVRLTEVHIELSRPLVHWTGAQIHALRGDWDAAQHHVGEALADLHHYEVMLIPSCLARAQVAEAGGDYERVVEALSPVVHLQERQSIDEPGFWPWPDVYANALVMTGRLDQAEAFLAPHEELATRRSHRSAMARLGLARGRLTAAPGGTSTPPARSSSRPSPTSNTYPSRTTAPASTSPMARPCGAPENAARPTPS
ncbi:hypothetical protein SAMN04487981_1352 [Streptomyces sp. cf386]|nr:hypothetical protein SAMN04487981_1352 [Streptomyces sp. cf386]